ncbi:MAG: xylulokinase [Planctomycetota bacterium]|jgi:xylulokinase
MSYLVGIDIGTSGTKTILCNYKGKIISEVTVEYPCYSPKPGWSEQKPEDWWKASIKSVKAVIMKSGVKGSAIKGIGLSGQMHGLVCIDKKGKVLRDAILWNDQRTAAECDEITKRAGGEKKLLKMVSNPALTGFTAPKILWVRKHEPRIYEKTDMMLLPKDYIRYKMTGTFATEVSDASGTLLLDVSKRKWSKALLTKLDISSDLLPDVFESYEVSGEVNSECAKLMGISAGTPVVGGGGDQAAGAVGNGIVKKGIVSATLGTSGVVFAHADKVETDPLGRVHTFCHAVPGKWHVMGVVLAAGGAFQWFRNNLAGEEIAAAVKKKCDPYEILTAGARKVPAGCEGLYFLPYLTGERTPHADPYARACFIGLTPRCTKSYMARSVMEGATYAMKDSFEIMQGMGIKPREVRLSGGGAKSSFWSQMQADIYNCNCTITNSFVGPAYGVMLLAGVGTGVWKSVEEACSATIKVKKNIKKKTSGVKEYKKYYPMFGKLYKNLKSSFSEISKI